MKVPTPCEYRRTVEIEAPVEQVFAFHADPRNVSKISPGWQAVQVKKSDLARVDDEFEIEVRFFGVLPLRWRGIWREVISPDLLVDEALQSPFAYWRHRHKFERLDARRTRMTDHVSYLLPGGWPGKIFGETLGRWQFAAMFADRQARTRRWLGAQARSAAIADHPR